MGLLIEVIAWDSNQNCQQSKQNKQSKPPRTSHLKPLNTKKTITYSLEIDVPAWDSNKQNLSIIQPV